ncbi:jg17609 [Pararge aegeria aegeria]|uniref:Jg17609 protein n=1 Tax=Pararge aegeria aegeria TaxID=348720 RepID=A0A8S4SGT5_9NEOP|nr:jg17609 [Pararge aegeria aegeria]
MWLWVLCVAAAAVFSAEGAGAGAARLICYVENARASDFTECTHLVYAGDARGEKLDVLLKDYRKNNPRLKIVLRVSEVDKRESTGHADHITVRVAQAQAAPAGGAARTNQLAQQGAADARDSHPKRHS